MENPWVGRVPVVVMPCFLFQTEPGALRSTHRVGGPQELAEGKLKQSCQGRSEGKTGASSLHPSLSLTNEVLD